MKKSIIISIFFASTLPISLFAAQPLDASAKSTIAAYEALAMDESDMGDVSGVAGPNVLNVYGASAGGLMQESEEPDDLVESLNEWGFNEGKKTQVFADKEISKIERTSDSNINLAGQTNLDDTPLTIERDSTIEGGTQAFNTSSAINYKKSNFHHETRQLKGNSIAISRDLHIDLLKIENLGGDDFQTERSAGSIYMSNWSSQGDTILTPR